jgi:hypothetical protein
MAHRVRNEDIRGYDSSRAVTGHIDAQPLIAAHLGIKRPQTHDNVSHQGNRFRKWRRRKPAEGQSLVRDLRTRELKVHIELVREEIRDFNRQEATRSNRGVLDGLQKRLRLMVSEKIRRDLRDVGMGSRQWGGSWLSIGARYRVV